MTKKEKTLETSDLTDEETKLAEVIDQQPTPQEPKPVERRHGLPMKRKR